MSDEKSKLIQALVGDVEPGKKIDLQEMVDSLRDAGYVIDDPAAERAESVKIRSKTTDRWKGGTRLKFGVVSDTQLGSRKQQLTFLNQVYDRFADEGIDTVLHAGDVVDGDGRVYPGQEYDLFIHGYDKQLDYAVKNYPSRKGITTHAISGNHDWSFWQRKGADIIRAMSQKRDDIRYLGYGGSAINLNGINIYLIHLKSGLTYARSYKIQKIIEQFAPLQKPDFMFAGDKHSWAHVPMYRNVHAWQMGCFQAQTDHEKRLGLFPEVGGLIVEVWYGTQGSDKRDVEKPGHEGRKSVVEVTTKILPQYVPIPNDF